MVTSAKPVSFLMTTQNAKRPEGMKLRVLSVGSGARRAPRGKKAQASKSGVSDSLVSAVVCNKMQNDPKG